MGFDISFHPINQKQMHEWYFDCLADAMQGKQEALKSRAVKSGMNVDFIDIYTEIMKVAATTEPQESFEKTHAYYIAVIQGLFHKYYYVRGSAISFLTEEHPETKQYVTPWETVKPESIPCPVANSLAENYSGGVYLDEAKVTRLADDLDRDNRVKNLFEDYFGPFYTVFEKALQDAHSQNLGLLEASEVIEPNPLDLNSSSSYSNLMNCDTEGALIYQRIALEQIRAARDGE